MAATALPTIQQLMPSSPRPRFMSPPGGSQPAPMPGLSMPRPTAPAPIPTASARPATPAPIPTAPRTAAPASGNPTSAPPPAAAPGTSPALSGVGSYSDQVNNLITQGNGLGAFGPNFLRDYVRNASLRNALATRNHSAILAHILGLDPSQMGVAAINAENTSQGNVANSMNNAELQGASGWQNFLRALLTHQMGAQDTAHAQSVAANQSNMGEIGQILGALGTAAVG